MSVKIQNAKGAEINTLKEWEKLARPAHWKDFRSAKELARAWLRKTPHEVPYELLTLFETRVETRGLNLEVATAEVIVRLDDFGGNHRNSDLVAEGQKGKKKLVVSIEAKADERFGNKTIGQALKNANPNRTQRIDHLSRAVFGTAVNDKIADLRYQLLHALAAAVIEAENRKSAYAIFVIHEFKSHTLNQTKVAANARDLEAFIHAVPGWENQAIRPGRLLPPIQLCGDHTLPRGKCVPRLPPVLFGKIITDIPLDAE